MTSPATNTGATQAPRYLCDRCGRRLTAAQALLAHVADPRARRPAICPGVPQPIAAAGVVTLPIARDDRGGITLPIAIQPVGRGQLEPSGSGQVEGGTDAVGDRHETIVVTPAAPGHVNPTSAVLAVVDEGRVSP